MASQRIGLGVTLVLVAMLWTGSTAQSDCTNVIISMSPCLNYITGNSSAPTSGCCTQLGSVVRSRPECLCQVLNGGGSSLGLDVNQTQAEALPAACKVQTPPLSSCKASSPSGTSDSPTKVPSDGSGRGSNTVPSTDNGSSDGSSNKLATPLLFFLLLVASYASTFTM